MSKDQRVQRGGKVGCGKLAAYRAPRKKTRRAETVLDHAADPEVVTDVSFGKALQSVAECMSAHKFELAHGKGSAGDPFDQLCITANYSKAERELFNRFDKCYRGHVYRQLLRSVKNGGRYGFKRVESFGEKIPMKGGLSGSDVFAAVWAKLFGVRYDTPKSGKTKKEALKSYFLDFDFSREKVGQGAFRAYLDEITYTVYREMVARDLVPLKDVHGRVMRNDKGKVIYVPRDRFDPEETENARKGKTVLDLANGVATKEKVGKIVHKHSRLLLELSFLAYFRLFAEETVCPKWFRPYAKELFEKGEDDKKVRAKARMDDSVPSVGAFDKELSCFRKKIRKLRDEMLHRMYSFQMVEAKSELGVRVVDPKEVLEQEWDELALWVGGRRMHDIRYNVVRAIMG